MKRITCGCFLICFVSIFAIAQQPPFKVFDEAVKEQRGGFNGNKENLSIIFNQERIRLGENFEVELWKFLGNDVEKHYWIGSFVKSKSYLHNNKPLPELAFKIWQNGIKLIGNKDDEESISKKYSLMILLSVLAEQLGKKEIAVAYKNDSELLLNNKPQVVGGTFPAMYKNELCIYNNIGKDTSICTMESEPQKPKEIIISGGILNGKATSLPTPKYPQEARKEKLSGIVRLKVLVDKDGKVIMAEGFEGHPKLFDAAINAAKKAKFKPTKLSGELVKVSGILIYKFIY